MLVFFCTSKSNWHLFFNYTDFNIKTIVEKRPLFFLAYIDMGNLYSRICGYNLVFIPLFFC